ncbi:hypothetical protein Clacol_006352 [Clathrus columnatus]|uniref:Uncharacterized protein n=1 Tax=Clathrus columnatus TaxID=1419009 RepID=A0AAV5AI02_9AGAM|nr:hypothetical protein Clacol_006352 [Clathrus columnatus]
MFNAKESKARAGKGKKESLKFEIREGETSYNPFASTHSLDANPFDDPPNTSHANRLEELNRRERDLQAREQELNRKAENIRRHGKNNFPPCTLVINLIACIFILLAGSSDGGRDVGAAAIVYAVIGVPSTGLAGLINTIQMYTGHHFVAAVLGTIATVGWAAQGCGLGFLYRQIWYHHNDAGHSVAKAKSELAEHGAKAYFTRG